MGRTTRITPDVASTPSTIVGGDVDVRMWGGNQAQEVDRGQFLTQQARAGVPYEQALAAWNNVERSRMGPASVPGGMAQYASPNIMPGQDELPVPGRSTPTLADYGAAEQERVAGLSQPELRDERMAAREARGGYGSMLPASGMLPGPESAGLEQRLARRAMSPADEFRAMRGNAEAQTAAMQAERMHQPDLGGFGGPMEANRRRAAQMAAEEAQQEHMFRDAGRTQEGLTHLWGPGAQEGRRPFGTMDREQLAGAPVMDSSGGLSEYADTQRRALEARARGEDVGRVGPWIGSATSSPLPTPEQVARREAAEASRADELAMRNMLVQNRAAQRGGVRGRRLGIPRGVPATMTPEVAMAMMAEQRGGLGEGQMGLLDEYRYGRQGAETRADRRFRAEQLDADRRSEREIAEFDANQARSTALGDQLAALRQHRLSVEPGSEEELRVDEQIRDIESELQGNSAPQQQSQPNTQDALPTPGSRPRVAGMPPRRAFEAMVSQLPPGDQQEINRLMDVGRMEDAWERYRTLVGWDHIAPPGGARGPRIAYEAIRGAIDPTWSPWPKPVREGDFMPLPPTNRAR